MHHSYKDNFISAQLTSVIEQLVDNKTGLIKQLIEVPLQPSETGLFIYSAECSDTRYAIGLDHSTQGRSEQIASGAALDPEEALWSTIGEACERYIASYFFEQQTIYCSQKSLGNNVTDLREFIGFSDEQYNREGFIFSKPDIEKEINWAQGFSLNSNEKVHIPAQLVWLGFPHKHKSEKLFPQISTGLAAGASLDHALLTGLREVIERDAFTTHWLLQHTPKKIRLEDVTSKHPKIKELISRNDHEVHLLWMETDVNVPCVTCIIRLPNKAGIALGMSCHLDSIVAAEKAIVEAFHTYNWILEMRRSGLAATKQDEIFDFEHHIRFYFEPKHHELLEFMVTGDYLDSEDFYSHSFTNPDYKLQLEEVKTRLTRAGHQSYAVDISKQEFTNLGIYAAKAFVPSLQPLHVGVGYEYLDLRRLTEISDRWNIEFPAKLNLTPHPFP